MNLEKQYSEAKSALSNLESDKSSFVRGKLSEAEAAIRAEAATKFDADITAARTASQLAYTAHMAEVEATASRDAPRPVGTVYMRWKREPASWRMESKGPRPLKPTGDTGVLEVVTRQSVFADNLASYSRPEIGSLILRLRKKNGGLGLKFVEARNFIPCSSYALTWFPEGHDPNEDAAKARQRQEETKREEWLQNPVLC